MNIEIDVSKKLHKEIDNNEMQERHKNIDEDMYFYYLRRENRHIFGGACLKKVDGVWYRGISLLSVNDKLDKATAKRQARKRLVRAIMTRRNDLPINPDAHESCNKLFVYYPAFFHEHIGNTTSYIKAYKAKYNAELTKAEERMVSKEETTQ